MKNWEDIVKDKLEGYESPLPEGSLAEFRARRDAAGSAAAKRSPLLWIVPTAVAAGMTTPSSINKNSSGVSLKSIARLIGAEQLADDAAFLEMAGKEDDFQSL